MSLKKRFQILLLFLVGFPLLLLLVESYRAGRQALIAEMKQQALQVARLETAEMDLTFDPPRIIADGITRSLETAPLITADSVRNLLRRTLHDTPGMYGVAVALDPALTPLGRFAPYFLRRKGIESETVLTYDYQRADWYRRPFGDNRGTWISPYFGAGGQTLMVTYTVPIHREGRIIGVTAVDLDLESLVKRLTTLRPGGDGVLYLASREGRILAHPARGVMADLGGSAGLGGLADLIRHEGVDTVQMEDPVSHLSSWVVETPIPSLSATRGGADWSLIVSWPLRSRLAPLTGMARRMLVLYLFMGGAALWFLNRTIDDTVTRPLRKLARQARGYAEGSADHHPVPPADVRELRELGEALNALGRSLEEQTRQPDRRGERP